MLDSINVRNFKALKKADLDLSKLNLLIGPNASGKSSVLQAIALLRQSTIGALSYAGDYVDLGSFEDTVFKHKKELRIQIETTFSLSESNKKKLKEEISKLEELKLVKSKTECNKLTYSVGFDTTVREGELRIDDSSVSEVIDLSGGGKISNWRVHPTNAIPYFSFEYQSAPQEAPTEELKNFFTILAEICKQELNQVYFFGVFRGITGRIYALEEHMPKDVYTRKNIDNIGLKTMNMIIYARDIPDFDEKVDKIHELISIFDIKLKPRLIEKRSVAIDVIDKQIGIKVPIADHGFGTNQLIPIIVQGEFAPKDGVIMIEEPEIHLNPKYQVKLMDLFEEFIKEEKQVIATTHSDHIFLRLQRKIAEGRIKPEDVSVHYFFPEKGEIQTKPISFDKDGNPSWWPEGFFEEDFEETYKRAFEVAKKRREASREKEA